MNIGIDIDNVISEFDSMILKHFLIEDKKKRNTGIINKHAEHIVRGMFDWSEDEVEDFFASNMERLAEDLKTRKNCKLYMDKLLQEGHRLYLISHRVYPHYQHAYETTLQWLQKRKINFTDLIISKAPDKTEECKRLKIDIMVDDRHHQCDKMVKNGIDCILMLTKYNRNVKVDYPRASSWAQLYQVIAAWKN